MRTVSAGSCLESPFDEPCHQTRPAASPRARDAEPSPRSRAAELQRCSASLAKAVSADPHVDPSQLRGVMNVVEGFGRRATPKRPSETSSRGCGSQSLSLSSRSSDSEESLQQKLSQLLESEKPTRQTSMDKLETRLREVRQTMRQEKMAKQPSEADVTRYQEAVSQKFAHLSIPQRRQRATDSPYDHVVNSLAQYHEWSYANNVYFPQPGEQQRQQMTKEEAVEVSKNIRLLKGMSIHQ